MIGTLLINIPENGIYIVKVNSNKKGDKV